MKKQTSKKRLDLTTEKVRTLQDLGDDSLRKVVGGLAETSPTGHTSYM